MNEIRAGIDFGTHQTKVCLQITPDEGHGEPMYEFFKFRDLQGNDQYAIPSVVQLNEDNTLSYGFVDPSRDKFKRSMPVLDTIDYENDNFSVENEADSLYLKYKTSTTRLSEKDALRSMLELRKIRARELNSKAESEAKAVLKIKMDDYYKNCSIFRYFKQSTFAERPWVGFIDCDRVSIWYLSYVIFLLEEKYGGDFTITMGVPADEKNYEQRQQKCVSIILSAYNLVEDIYEGDFDAFLNENVLELYKKTEIIPYSKEAKEDNFINVYPEAYASLISLTSKGKLAKGLCLNADIGGGTTDISFFAVVEGKKLPYIYRYWSLPIGLNYIAEQSGHDFSEIEKVFRKKASESVVEEFNDMKDAAVFELYKNLIAQFRKEVVGIKMTKLDKALTDKILVYNGGGSIYEFISGPIRKFTDVKKISEEIWNDENIVDREKVGKLCHILTTSFGLSMGNDDNNVKLTPFTNLFKGIVGDVREERQMVDKDMC